MLVPTTDMVKPIDLDERAARLRSIGRRAAGRADSTIVIRDIAIDPAARSVTQG